MNVVPDTNVWIRWFRERALPALSAPGLRVNVLVSTIALQELWAGVRTDEEAQDIERLHELARRSRTLLNPPAAAWVLAGRVINLLATRHSIGAQRLRAMRNDVLLAANAVLANAAVVTENTGDFRQIAKVLPLEYCRP